MFMADKTVTPIRPPTARARDKADDLDLEAACHLTCAKAIADLVQSLADHKLLDELAQHTVSAAMDDIRRNIDAAEALYRKVWDLSWNKEVAHG
jgi:hypothetical protein